MGKLSLKMKLGIGFGAVLLILALMGLMAYRTVDELATRRHCLLYTSRCV